MGRLSTSFRTLRQSVACGRSQPLGIDNLRLGCVGGIIQDANPHPPPRSGSKSRALAHLRRRYRDRLDRHACWRANSRRPMAMDCCSLSGIAPWHLRWRHGRQFQDARAAFERSWRKIEPMITEADRVEQRRERALRDRQAAQHRPCLGLQGASLIGAINPIDI